MVSVVTRSMSGAEPTVRSLKSPTSATNPGDLRMFSFVPEHLQQRPRLVVVLHGCGQTAAGYDLGAGWSTLAKHYGFALLMPEQQPSNNAKAASTGSIRKTPRATTAKPARSGR